MKHLKPVLAILLSLVMLMSAVAAFAEELPYMEQLTQSTYMSLSLLTTDSYPEVCIAPYYFSSMYISQYKDPGFIKFPCPPNTFAANFDEYSASFVDMDYGYQYTYIGQENYAYETFCNKCEVDDYILEDGSSGVAIYLDPDACRAYALLSAAEIAKGAKLEIRIYDSSLKNKSEQLVIEGLSTLIYDEVQRVQSAMTFEFMDNYWTDGRFAGFNVICNTRNTNGLTMNYTLPAGYFITDMDSERVAIATINGEDNALTAKFDLGTYSYVDYQTEEDPEHVTTVTIDGADYRVYSHWYDDKKITLAYVDRVISTTAGYDKDDTLYLTIDLDMDGDYEWTSVEALEGELANIVSGIQINYDQDVPDYRNAAPYSTASVAAAPAANDGAWTCADCGTENSGNFCTNCGNARPTEIVCSNCGYAVPEGETPKFCANCGNAF